MILYWRRIIKLSSAISLLNFSIFNVRHRFKEKFDLHFFVLSSFLLSLFGLLYYQYFHMGEKLYLKLFSIGFADLYFTLAIFVLMGILTITSLFLMINLYCFSRDSESLQVLPIHICDIFISKYITVIKFCYLFEFLVLLPLCLIQIRDTEIFETVCTYVSITVILPHIVVLPLAIITTICLRLSVILKGFRVMSCILGYGLYIGGIVLYRANMVTDWQTLRTHSDLIGLMNDYLNPFPYYQSFLGINTWLKLFCVLIPMLAVGIYYVVNKFFMNKQYILYTKCRKHIVTAVSYRSSPKIKSYLIKESKTFFRSPVYILNGLFGIAITPFLLPLSFQLGIGTGSVEQIRHFVVMPEVSSYAVLFAIGVIVVTSSINVISASSFSREGANYWIIKIIPYNLRNQAYNKALFAMIISFIGVLINSLIFKFYFGYSFPQVMTITIVSTLFCILWNLIGVFIDMKHPKLAWMNEAEAIKQNINVVISIIVCIGLSAIYFFAVKAMVAFNFLPVTVICLVSISLVLLSLLVCKGIAFFSEM